MATTTTRMSITLTSNPSTSASSPSASHNLIQSSPVNNKKRKRTSTKQQLRLDEPNLPESTPKQSNANRYPCDFKGCHKSYSKPSRLKEHQRVHTGERPFKCNHPDCQASYMRNSHLVAHKRTHLDSNAASAPTTSNQDQVQDEFSIRPFACDRQGCSQRFWTRQHLNRHVEGVHDDSRALEDQTQTETEVEVGGKDDDDGWMTNSSQSRKVSIGNGNDGSDLEGKKRRRRKRPGGEGAYKCSVQGCKDTFSKRKHLRAHIWSAHSLLGSNPQEINQTPNHPNYSTSSDPIASTSQIQLSNPDPNQILPLPFQCTHQGCLKRFPTNAKRKQHLRTHQTGRYACSLDHTQGQIESYLKNWRDINGKQMGDEEGEEAFPEEPFPNILYFESWSKLRSHMKLEHKKGKHKEASSDLEDQDQDEEEEEEILGLEGKGRSKSDETKAFVCTYDLDHIAPPSTSIDQIESSSNSKPQDSTSSSSSTPCTKSFTRLSALRTHIRVHHLGEKRFICQNKDRGCEKRYAYRHLLRKHEGKCWFRVQGEESSFQSKNKKRKTSHNSKISDDDEDSDEEEAEEKDEEADDEEEEDENEIFRKEGGAIPEKYSSRQAVISTKEEKIKRNGLLDKLTGSGYDPTSFIKRKREELQDQEDEEDNLLEKKKRKVRGRVLKCPWSTISEMMKKVEQDEDEDGDGEMISSDVDEEVEMEEKDCLHRFSRMYDLRRHVKASHQLDLTENELKAFIPLEEKQQLPKERRKK